MSKNYFIDIVAMKKKLILTEFLDLEARRQLEIVNKNKIYLKKERFNNLCTVISYKSCHRNNTGEETQT